MSKVTVIAVMFSCLGFGRLKLWKVWLPLLLVSGDTQGINALNLVRIFSPNQITVARHRKFTFLQDSYWSARMPVS